MNGQQSLILQAIDFAGVGGYDYYGSNLPASYRYGYGGSTYNGSGTGFRPALYVKV